jgi:DNA polymerase
MIAPDGFMLIDCDSSQIEARVLSWLAGQHDLTEAFQVGDDVYKKMAMSIYGVNRPEDVTKDQRFVGKTTILGAGYGMGAVRFKDQLQSFGFDMELDEARRVINIYRETNFQITRLWNDASHTIRCMEQGVGTELGIKGVISVDPTVPAIILPSGLQMRYEDLRGEQGERGVEYTYKVRRGRNRIYGGKVIENVCQAVARCIIGEQMLKISKRYRVVLTVHDSVVCCVPEDEVEEAQRYIEGCMRWLPDWAEGLPIDCESGVAKSYGDCE